ncbi:MAG: hypothetical protein AAGF12_15790 [Myxococcota bacterium]
MIRGALLLCVIAGCSDDDAMMEPDLEGPWEALTERPCPDESILTYENFGRPFMLDWCTGCHSSQLPEGLRANAPLMIDLETQDFVVAQMERVWARAGDDNETMPPAGGPGPDERRLLGEWLACGAPNDADLGL